ncbi:uncharacterized protein LOC108950348 isoform X2 [Ciona intestinalis]
MKTFLAVVVSLVVLKFSLAANFPNLYVKCGANCLQRFLECTIEGNKETGIKCAKPNETFIETFFGSTCPDEAHWIFSAINKQCSGNCYDATIEANYTCSVSNSSVKIAKSRCYNQNCSGIWLEINSTSCNANCGGGDQRKTRRCFDQNGNITKSSYNCQGTNGDEATQKSDKETLERDANATDCESGGVVIDNDVISYITMHSLRKSIPEPDCIPSVELYGNGNNLVAPSATDSESWESESNDENQGNPNIQRERTRKVRKSKKTRRTLKQVPTEIDKQYDVPNVFPAIPDIYAVKTEVNNTTQEGSDSAYDSLNNIPKQRFTSRPSPVPRTSRIRHNKIAL